MYEERRGNDGSDRRHYCGLHAHNSLHLPMYFKDSPDSLKYLLKIYNNYHLLYYNCIWAEDKKINLYTFNTDTIFSNIFNMQFAELRIQNAQKQKFKCTCVM
jgi:hypothetical protein